MTRRRARLAGVVAASAAALVAMAGPAAAENPVFDPEDDADVAASLAEATEVQEVCYGYVLSVDDQETGTWSGTYASSSAGEGVAASAAPDCRSGVVELRASITYTAEWSEAEDSASWTVAGDVPEVGVDDLDDLGLASGDLLDDADSGTTLLNAVLALPRIASEQAGLPPVLLEPNPSPLPEGARPTASPGSDWLRESAALLVACVLAIGGGIAAFVTATAWSRGPQGRHGPGRPPRIRSFGPPPDPLPAPGPPSDPWRS